MTFKDFRKQFPEFKHLPKRIIGVNGKPKLLMDATYADFQAYQRHLQAKIDASTAEEVADLKRIFDTPTGGTSE